MTYKPNEEGRILVRQLSAAGLTQESVSSVLEISVETLMKYYRNEYENGNELMVAELMPVCMKVATDVDHKDSVKERHFLLERKGGFVRTERQEVEHSVAGELKGWLGDAS